MAVEGVTIYFEGNTVQFDKSVDGIEKSIKVLKKQTKAYNDEFKKTGSIDALKNKINSLYQEWTKSVRATKEWADEFSRLQNKQTELLAVGKNLSKEEQARMESAAKHWEAAKSRTAAVRKNLTDSTKLLAEMSQSTSTFADALKGAGEKMVAVADATKSISQASQRFLKDAVNESINFEDAFAEVKKTLTLTDDEAKRSDEIFESIARSLRDLSTTVPTSADDLAQIAGLAGQMGVGADYIVEFTKAMVDFGNATNITATEAAQDIAQIYNVIGKGGDYSDLDNLLSTIVELGNNSATTEKDIVEMFRNISSAASRVGMNQSQMVALASTLSSLGLDKGGASAISNIMQQIDIAVDTNSQKLWRWAKDAGMSVAKFKKSWGEDAAGTLAALLENLKQTVDAGGSLNKEFQDLGIKELRRVDTLGRLVNAQQIYADSLQMAANAYKDGNALSEEAAKRYETLKSKLDILKNKFDEFKRTIGDQLAPVLTAIVEFAGRLLDIINALPGGVNTLITVLTTLMAVLSPLLGIAGKYLLNITDTEGKLGGLISKFTGFKGILLGVFGALVTLYATNEDFRNAVNKTATDIWEHLKPALENAWELFKTLWDIGGLVVNKFQELWDLFMNSTAAKVVIETFNAIIEIIKVLIDVVAGVIEGFAGIFKWLGKVLGLESEVQANMPRSVSVLESGGFNGMASGGMVVNNSFTINGTEQLSNSRLIEVADIITDRVNENLGRMV